MKKVYLIGALGGLLLASCANDDLVVKPVANTGSADAAIAFNMNLGNMSRAGYEDLNEVMNNFGVYAFKGNSAADINGISNAVLTTNTNVVMPDYRVNYFATQSYGSNWSYVLDNFMAADGTTALTQYLKYWDGGVSNTYFFGYGPHNSTRYGDDTDLHAYDVKISVADAVATMKFPTYVMNSDADYNYIYADAKVENNKAHVAASSSNTTIAPQTVSLKFHRILSQLKIAFYEDIPGYKVKMVDVFPVAGEDAKVAAIPANRTVDASATAVWNRGKFVNQVVPTVKYSKNSTDFDKAEVFYTDAKTTTDNVNFALPSTNLNGEYIADKNDYTGTFTPKNHASFSATVYNVVPNAVGHRPSTAAYGATAVEADANSGWQFVVNYDLCSIDTKEVIHVKGARVYVNSDYTNWAPNTIYTYYFHITKNSSGTTKGTDPVNDPVEPEPCLYPIIFDGVEIEKADTNEHEWDINNLVMSQTEADIYKGETLDLIVTDISVPTPVTGVTWDSNNDAIATVADGTVTGVEAGTAIITAEAGNDDHDNAKEATCTVRVHEYVISPATVTVEVDATATLVVKDLYDNSTLTGVTWTSSSSAIASVDDGIVTGVSDGTATITATVNGHSATCTVIVTTPEP